MLGNMVPAARSLRQYSAAGAPLSYFATSRFYDNGSIRKSRSRIARVAAGGGCVFNRPSRQSLEQTGISVVVIRNADPEILAPNRFDKRA